MEEASPGVSIVPALGVNLPIVDAGLKVFQATHPHQLLRLPHLKRRMVGYYSTQNVAQTSSIASQRTHVTKNRSRKPHPQLKLRVWLAIFGKWSSPPETRYMARDFLL